MEIEAKTKEIEAKTKEIEAKSQEIEAKCLSKAEIKELITEDCSKNSCQNVKRPINGRPNRRPGPRGPRLDRSNAKLPTKPVPSQNGFGQTARRARPHRTRQNSRPRKTAKEANAGFVPNIRLN